MNPIVEKPKFRDSVILKLIVIGLLILALLAPVGMVALLVGERQGRHDQVVRAVAETWGGAQTLGGPVLTVPYREIVIDDKGKQQTLIYRAHFLPEGLSVQGEVAPEKRSRGIFDVVVYRAELHATGSFRRPTFAAWPIEPRNVLWDEAYLSIGVPDMRGIRRQAVLSWRGRPLQLAPGGGADGLWTSGLKVPIPDLGKGVAGERYPFAFDLGLNGTGSLRFLPFGEQTNVALRSTWPDPSFTGAFLPGERKVGERGFSASWSIPYFGRGYPQQWLSADVERVAPPSTLASSSFGVDLYLPVDAYQKTERSVKYAILFLLLTFLTFFLYEVLSPIRLHPVQYLLVGSALCLFYLLLLTISEHAVFALAYAIASAATITLIGGYALSILRGRGRALLLTGVLAGLYGYLYVLLQAEDLALLLGAIGLFVILAIVMYVTRRIDWYGAGRVRVEGEVG